MGHLNRIKRVRTAALAAALCVAAALPASAGAKVKFTRISTVNASSHAAAAMARTPDGRLHLVFQTFVGRGFHGLAALTISASGAVGPQVQALPSWQTSQPGLVASSNGALTAFFGAANPNLFSTVWGMSSFDGGSTWGAPFDVRGTGPNEALADVAPVTAAVSGTTPILALPSAGHLVMQVGLGPTAANYEITTAADGSATDADLAVDAVTGQVVAGWRSGNGAIGDWLQGAAPTVGAAQPVPGQGHDALIPSGRDKGAGVFAAYSSDGFHIRLLRYGGGSVAVGRVPGLRAQALGTATGLGGRIWVLWGTDNPSGVAVTRSNRAVTRFEPIQRLDPKSGSLYRVSGDGRLGPLDLFVDQIPSTGPIEGGNFYARVLPELSASASVVNLKTKKGKLVAHKLTVKVTDAGDAVPGATVTIAGKKAKTNAAGAAKLSLSPSLPGHVTMTVTAPGYQPLSQSVKL